MSIEFNSQSNPGKALEWLSQNKTIGLNAHEFFAYGGMNNVSLWFNRKDEKINVQKLVNFIQENLFAVHNEQRGEWLKLSEGIIKKYAHNCNVSKIVAVFDREIVKQDNQIGFSHFKHQAAFKKWQSYDMPEALFLNHPEFCSFLESSGLLSQIKVTRSEGDVQVRPKEIDGEAALFVEGEWMKWSQFKNNFEVIESPLFKEKFIVHIESRHVYTYLDNGKGLQPHHPYLTELSPISKLNEEEYQKVLGKAHTFIRPEEADFDESERAEKNNERTFVIQIVSSYVNGLDTNVHRFTHNADHPYIRMIVGRDNPVLNTYKGDVFEVGYRTKHKIPLPLTASQGQFRSPDVCEYKMCKEKVVTNIPVTKEEAFAFYRYTQGYFRDSMNLGKAIGFHFMKQNCTTYVRKSLLAAGIKVPTEISLDNLLKEIAPTWIKQVGLALKHANEKFKEGIKECLFFVPTPMINSGEWISAKITECTLKVFEAFTALSFFPLKAVLGDASGDGGVAFASPGETHGVITPELSNWKTWYRLSHYKFNLPGVLQDWQRQQPSTFVKERAIKLAIVP